MRQVIHVGPPQDIESYIQHIGRSGRDGKPACALLLYGPKLMENTTQALTKYCTLSDLCRRNYLFADFESYTPSSVCDSCRCCDICVKSCTCGICIERLIDFIL